MSHRGFTFLSAFLLSWQLLGCGGGGGGGDGGGGGSSVADSGTPTPVGPTYTIGAIETACTGCAATTSTTYAGTGTGVWHVSNTGTTSMQVPVAISGLAGQDVQLVMTNESQNDIALPSDAFLNMSSSITQSSRSEQFRTPMEAAIAEFNRKGWHDAILETRKKSLSQLARPNFSTSYLVNDTRSFYHDDTSNPNRNATLVKQVTSSDGRTVNFWVETTEYAVGKVTSSIVDSLANRLVQNNGIYDSIISLGGPLWGAHSYIDLISDTNRPLDIVLLNFDNNGAAYGTVGYFWAMHSLLRSTEFPNSNESLSLYLDTETMYKDGTAGQEAGELTLAHELVHMSNFYRRAIAMSPSHAYDTWLNEMTAMVTEDLVSSQFASFNPIGSLRLPQYLGKGLSYSSFNCSLQVWTAYSGTCDSYSVSGSFGGFLVRQLGVDFFKNLLTQSQTNSLAALDAAIKSVAPTSSVAEQFRRFTATAAGVMPANNAPTGYGFPARSDSGFDLPEIDAFTFKDQRRLPASTPSLLKTLATHPVVRKNVTGTFKDTVIVPPGASLSVVIH